MANATVRIENDNILEKITKHRMRVLNRATMRFLPRETKCTIHLSRYCNYTELDGARVEAYDFDYMIGEEDIGFIAVRNVGYARGMLNMSLPEDCLKALLDYLKRKNDLWYEILDGDSRKKIA